jgi:DNA-binding MarR family transcriptional regulator
VSAHAEQNPERRPTIEDLQLAVTQMFGAERRLRSRDHSRPGELSHAQLRTLVTLGREQELSAGQLARTADLNPATVTAMLDQLEAANIVQRHRSTEDRRVCNVSLTPEGWKLLERKREYWQSLWDQQFAEFNDADLEAAARVIHQIADIYNTLSTRLESAPRKEAQRSTSGAGAAAID